MVGSQFADRMMALRLASVLDNSNYNVTSQYYMITRGSAIDQYFHTTYNLQEVLQRKQRRTANKMSAKVNLTGHISEAINDLRFKLVFSLISLGTCRF